MPYTGTFTNNATIDGVTTTTTNTVVSDNRAGSRPTSVPASKTGQLTTRTNATTGTLTMAASHGIATADVFDLYWDGGSRQGVVAGTVSVNSVPISGGTGDDLPANLTAIQAMEWYTEDLTVDGDVVTSLIMSSSVPSTITLLESDGTTVVESFPLEADDSTSTKYVYIWDGTGTSPVAGGAIGKIGFTHGSTSAQTNFAFTVQYD